MATSLLGLNQDTPLRRENIQGLVVSGYGSMSRATYLLLSVQRAEAARVWLASFVERVTSSVRPEEARCLNLAFTAQGLRAMGVSDPELRTFPTAFYEGMAAPHRTITLGDTGVNGPDGWHWGGPGRPALHACLLIYGKDELTFQEVEASERASLDGAFDVVHELRPEPLPGRVSVGKFGVEHFGFADGMSQPVIKGSGQDDKLSPDDHDRQAIDAGEFVLGYTNGYGKLTPMPRLTSDHDPFGADGTYLVIRQLAQDVASFWQFLDRETKASLGVSDPAARSHLAAKMVGRWESGAPLSHAPDVDNPSLGTDNSFGYASDDNRGTKCPVASHVRRTNPRDSLGDNPKKALELANLHRILRRGRVYGPGLDDPLAGDDGIERGLFFMCLNANIERQFEFIQHTWCNNEKFGGLYDEQDPIIGNPPSEGGKFSMPQDPVRRRVSGIPSFVTTKGGEYFFLPSISALRQLSSLTGQISG